MVEQAVNDPLRRAVVVERLRFRSSEQHWSVRESPRTVAVLLQVTDVNHRVDLERSRQLQLVRVRVHHALHSVGTNKALRQLARALALPNQLQVLSGQKHAVTDS